MKEEIRAYHEAQSDEDRRICDVLYSEICKALPEAEHKIWHRHPVWFLDGNPTVGYNKLKNNVRLMFWSGMDFNEEGLKPGTGKFKDASAHYTNCEQINTKDLRRWLEKSKQIQWDYKNLIRRKGIFVHPTGV